MKPVHAYNKKDLIVHFQNSINTPEPQEIILHLTSGKEVNYSIHCSDEKEMKKIISKIRKLPKKAFDDKKKGMFY